MCLKIMKSVYSFLWRGGEEGGGSRNPFLGLRKISLYRICATLFGEIALRNSAISQCSHYIMIHFMEKKVNRPDLTVIGQYRAPVKCLTNGSQEYSTGLYGEFQINHQGTRIYNQEIWFMNAKNN